MNGLSVVLISSVISMGRTLWGVQVTYTKLIQIYILEVGGILGLLDWTLNLAALIQAN